MRAGVFAGERGPRSAQRPVCTVGGFDERLPAGRAPLPALMVLCEAWFCGCGRALGG